MAHDPDEQLQREHKRQDIIEAAVRAADRIILEGSDGVEETDYITAQVAQKFLDKVIHIFTARMLRKDLGL